MNNYYDLNRQGPNQPPSRPPFYQNPPFFGQPDMPSAPPFTQPSTSQSGPPSSPPPNFQPQQSVGLYKVDPGAIRPCLYRYSYIWLEDGRSFWAWLTFAGRRSVAGWRWTGFRWVYFGTDVDNIASFQCY